jgi:hypothetical protein
MDINAYELSEELSDIAVCLIKLCSTSELASYPWRKLGKC